MGIQRSWRCHEAFRNSEKEPRQSSSRHDHMGQEGHTPPDVVGSETVELATVAAATAAVTSTFDADT